MTTDEFQLCFRKMNREIEYWGTDSSANEGSDSSSHSASDDDNRNNRSNRNRRKKKIKEGTKINGNKISKVVLAGLNKLRIDNILCDIVIKVGSCEIKAHKNVLCSSSYYFMTMFNGNFTENTKNIIEMKNVNFDAFKLLIEFIYTGNLLLNADNIQEVFITAKYLQIDCAEEICLDYLANNISLDNYMNLIEFSANQSIKKLTEKLIKFVLSNFHEVYTKEEFLNIPFDELKMILNDKTVKRYPEDHIYILILRWINFDIAKRLDYLDEILSTIVSNHITLELLNSKELLKNIPDYKLKNWLYSSEEINLECPFNRDIAVFKRTTGEFTPQLYKLNSEAFASIKMVPKDHLAGSFANHGAIIYHQGGYRTKKPVSDLTFCYNLYKNKWTPFLPLKYGRAYHRSCILNNVLFTIGGSDGRKSLDYVESLDLTTCTQKIWQNLCKPREMMGLSCHSNAIYVIGGQNRGLNTYSCMERMDPREGTWELQHETSYLNGISSSATFEDSIYSVCNNGRRMDRYDVKIKKWTSIRTQYDRYPSEVFEMKNELYGLFKDHIASYDVLKGKWKITHQFVYHHNNLTALPLLMANIANNSNQENNNSEHESENENDD